MTNRRTKPKYRICRQTGENLWGRKKCPSINRPYGPGQHGSQPKRRSVYGQQLLEKQKLKGYYGNITEKQFRKIFQEATRKRGNTSEILLQLLESRLDAIIYRLNFVSTVFAARQVVNHKHIKVNGQVVNIPSYRCKPGDKLEIREKSQKIPLILESLQDMERDVPEYLTIDPVKFSGTFKRLPDLGEIPYPVQMNPGMVVEFYSR